MAKYFVVQGTVKFGGELLGYGGELDLEPKDAAHLNAHGKVVVPASEFSKLEAKRAIETELTEDAEDAAEAAEEAADDEAVEKPAPAPKPTVPAKPRAKKGGKS
jgi:hypothetical protein